MSGAEVRFCRCLCGTTVQVPASWVCVATATMTAHTICQACGEPVAVPCGERVVAELARVGARLSSDAICYADVDRAAALLAGEDEALWADLGRCR